MNDWQNHPSLRDRLHPDYPGDLQVIAHDGGPRFTDHSPEMLWVRVTGCTDNTVSTGTVLNQPQQLTSIKQGLEITILVLDGYEYPLMVTEKYLIERPHWIVQACQECGLTELFDAPSDLISAAFPDMPLGSVPEYFTTFCGACGGANKLSNYTKRD